MAGGLLIAGQPDDVGSEPGRLLDIGGRKIHVLTSGTDAPTVVLIAGAGVFAVDWTLVQPEIARRNRVFAYDRAGLGWSDPPPAVETPETVVSDLPAVLLAAGESPPSVFVGASMGGIYARLYALRFPNEVAGMVPVDATLEDRLFAILEGKSAKIASLTAEQLRSTISSEPVTVPVRSPQSGTPFDRLPPLAFKQRVRLEQRLIASETSQPVPAPMVLASAEGQRRALAELQESSRNTPHPLGNRPLIVLTRGLDVSEQMKAGHAKLALLSTNSRHSVVPAVGHEIHLYQPDAVEGAVREVLDSLRNQNTLSGR